MSRREIHTIKSPNILCSLLIEINIRDDSGASTRGAQFPKSAIGIYLVEIPDVNQLGLN